MGPLTIRVPAKINLSLDVVGHRPDGYHLLSTIMQAVDVYDELTLETTAGQPEILLTSDSQDLVMDGRNTCCRAAAAFFAAAGIPDGVRIHILKRIPLSAGMGGGSADAAGVLAGLDRLYPGRVSPGALRETGISIGADVAFCMIGGTALCEGIGEYTTPLVPFDGVPLLIVKPAFGVSTAWVFSHLDSKNLGVRPDNPRVIRAMAAADLRLLSQTTGNVLESVTITAYPLLAQIRRWLLDSGAGMAAMSGSGPAMFGLYDDSARCAQAVGTIRKALGSAGEVLCTRTVSNGPLIQ